MPRSPKPPAVHCAIYTRKSTEAGLEQEFNSLDAQRESAEAFIKSQAHEGWVCLPDRYDDGGFSGGNTDRPALKRLLRDIEAGKVQTVVTYKVDRLSRSLLDFAKLMEVFDKHGVSFVSVTQQFNTTHSMGRLTLNVLLSFAQFERELISERTSDKIAAARRKGKYIGGRPVLGYDVVASKLVPNHDEAYRVREIFDLYLQHRALVPVARELNRRGWTTKRWTTKKGETVGGATLTKTNLHQLLTNVIYIGKVGYKTEVHIGEHAAIVDEQVFNRVQALLAHNGRGGGTRNKYNALLKNLVRCKHCDCAMSHSFTSKGKRRYRYYTCTHATKLGWDQCPAPSIPAPAIETWVVEQFREIGGDPTLVRETYAALRRQVEERTKTLRADERATGRELGRLNAEMGRVGTNVDLERQIADAERRLADVTDELATLTTDDVGESDVAAALADFDTLWESLPPREQVRVIELLIEQVVYDGVAGTVAITFRATGLSALSKLRETAA